MEAKELRIGNLVNEEVLGDCPIVSISDDGKIWVEVDNMTIDKEHNKRRFHLSKGNYNPIPLTEEWLLKFGFQNPAHSWICDKFHLTEWDNYPLNWCVAFNKNGAIIIDKLKHVHQLQNLFFCLTGEELKIIQQNK